MLHNRSRLTRWGLPSLAALMIGFAAAVALPGCSEDDTTAPGESDDRTGAMIEFGSCKTEGAKTADDTVASDRDIVEYELSGSSIVFHHINTAFNCCIDSNHADFSFVGDTIRIGENEALTNSVGCRCVCLYDISWVVRNVEAESYVIDVGQLYLEPGEEEHLFTIDLAGAPSGIHEIVRARSPWGDPHIEPEIEFKSLSDCKLRDKQRGSADLPDPMDCVQYVYDGSGELSITHMNTSFNCCIDSTPVSISVAGDTIRVTESEVLDTGGCECNCLYDLEFTVGDLPPGIYRLEIDQLYLAAGDEPHRFSIDLRGPVSDEHCLPRSGYVWNPE